MSQLVSVLDLAGEIARKHERAPLGQITVIPVIVDDLESISPVLSGLCDVAEGRFLTTLDDELKMPVPGTSDQVRRAAIVTALTGQPLSDRRVELIDQAAGTVDAVFANPTTEAPSPGEEEVLAVARAVAHRDLDRHRFALIAYKANLVDLPFRRGIWSLAVDQLNGRAHPTLTTLVFVAEAAIDIGVHCQPGRGFQLALDGGRLLRRKGADNLRAQAASIANNDGPLVLFLGAGFAATSRMPLGNDMRDQAIGRLLNVSVAEFSSTELASKFHDWVQGQGWLSGSEQQMPRDEFISRLTLEQVTRIEKILYPTLPTLHDFRQHHDRQINEPGQAVLDLAAILDHRRGPIVVVEVNFDLLVETHAGVPLRVFASPEEFAKAPEFLRRYLAGDETEVPLLKLHGTISRPDTCVISAEQTEQGVGVEKREALHVLRNENFPVRWVYVGASLRDLDIRPLLLGEEFSGGVDERWVTPYLPESLEEFAMRREPRWRGTGLPTIEHRLITETADVFFAELRTAWIGG